MIALVSINFRSARFSTIREIRVASIEFVEYSSKWIINIVTFRTIVLRFFEEIEEYRQTSVYQNFQSKSEIKTFDDNSTSNDTSIISKRRTVASQIIVFRIESRFRYENDILVIERNQAHVRIFRVSSYSSIIDSNNRFIIDNQQINNNQSIISNSTNTRETSVEKIIYEQSIEFNSIAIFMNSILQVVITTIVSVVVTQAIENIRAEIRQKMQQVNQRNRQESVESLDSSDSSEDDNDDNDNNQFQSKHLDFFDSFHDNKSVTIDATMKFTSESTIFRDVHLFMIKAKNFATIKDDDFVRRNLYLCLKSDVLNWYTSLLTDMKKDFLLLNQNLNQWEKYLVKKFRKTSTKIMKELVKKSYSMTNAQHERESKEYAQKIIRLDKSVELSIFNQLLQIWNELDIDFQLHVNKSINDIKLSDFLRDLNDKKHSWWKLISRQSFESISRKNVNAKDKNNREQREDRQSQRDMFETNYRDRDQSNVEYDDNVVDEYTQNDYFRFDIQSTFISAQFSNFVSQSNYVSQNYAQTWNQNRAYMQ